LGRGENRSYGGQPIPSDTKITFSKKTIPFRKKSTTFGKLGEMAPKYGKRREKVT